MILSNKWVTKMLIRLRWCADWSVPLLFANPQRQVFSCRGPYNRSITVSVILKHYLNNLLNMNFNKLFELVSTVVLQWMPSGLPSNSILNSQLSAIIIVTWIRRLPAGLSLHTVSKFDRTFHLLFYFTLPMMAIRYSKTCLKQPLKKNTKNWFSIQIIA